ncbi:FKBP-type peptidyl-prolyl cis-trans isomerase [Microbacterium awajiense]|uniref:peptidylprolyl isomerase n=1 Tax=Microbacterium awajiense TaxID=415214 RepID=A0ABP7A3Z6_9MICO
MRKLPASLAVLALASVGLVGCSIPAAADCPRPQVVDPDVMELITIDGQLGTEPQIDVYLPLSTPETAYQDVVRGDGAAITDAAQLVALDITIVSGETGETLVATAYDGSVDSVFSVERWEETIPAFDEALSCATEGSRIAMALAPGGIAEQAAVSLGIAESESAVAVVDVRKVYLPAANGSLVFNSGHGMPSVVRAPDGRPGIIVPDSAAPTEVVVQTLKKGDGAVVDGSAPVRVHYTGLTWDQREVFDTSWDGEPASLTLDGVVPGFAEALDGATVGSQILVVIPPDQGYGDQDQGAIPGGSTLVFVIDVLGLDTLEPAE